MVLRRKAESLTNKLSLLHMGKFKQVLCIKFKENNAHQIVTPLYSFAMQVSAALLTGH